MKSFLRGLVRRPETWILLLALAVRVAYVSETVDLGFFQRPVSDGLVYDERGQGIAGGDWLGPADFVHSPTYAYFLGLLYACVGRDLWVVRLVQTVIGVIGVGLVMSAGGRFFGRRAGLIAGVLICVYPPALFFDGLIQKTGLAFFLSAILLWQLAAWGLRAGAVRWTAIGVTCGLLALTRQNALVLPLLIVAWLWIGGRPGVSFGSESTSASPVPAERRRQLIQTCCLGLGLVLALLPWTIRNRVVTGEFVITTPNLGQNLAMGNHPNATGTYLALARGRGTAEHEQAAWTEAAERSEGRSLTPKQVSQHYLDAGLRYIRENPVGWSGLMIRKILLSLNAYESPDTEDYYLYREHSVILSGLDRVLHFGVLLPLAASGVVLSWRDRSRLWLLYGWLILTILAVAAFVVFARYRYPLVPVLAMFAGIGVVEGVRCWRERRRWRLCGALSVAAVAAVVANWSLDLPRGTRPFSYTNHAVALADMGRLDEAVGELNKALRIDADDVDALCVLGSVMTDLERYESALRHYEAARRGDPGYPGAYRGMGHALVGLARFDDAARQFQLALDLRSGDHLAMTGLATAWARAGRLEDAIDLFRETLRLAPEHAPAHLNLGNTYLTAGRLDDAARAYGSAIECAPKDVDALANLGALELMRGRPEQAAECFRRILARSTDARRNEAEYGLAAALIAAGRIDEGRALAESILHGDPGRSDMQGLLRRNEQP